MNPSIMKFSVIWFITICSFWTFIYGGAKRESESVCLCEKKKMVRQVIFIWLVDTLSQITNFDRRTQRRKTGTNDEWDIPHFQNFSQNLRIKRILGHQCHFCSTSASRDMTSRNRSRTCGTPCISTSFAADAGHDSRNPVFNNFAFQANNLVSMNPN